MNYQHETDLPQKEVRQSGPTACDCNLVEIGLSVLGSK
ncbi:hypothetical protein RISK_001257 [Rhodopirellula islandica]|uniref:Uncharacterized protein n=1 Tax=Rhodopirellula islandica TaxID=595434 RepID=A0A0J1BJU4_RHOIS|nr:hypothetical protein RISK_001257 [Rhodopirellula islandica]